MVPFVGPSYQLETRTAAVQRTVNLYPVVSEVPDGKASTHLRSVPGLTVFSPIPAPVALGGWNAATKTGPWTITEGGYRAALPE